MLLYLIISAGVAVGLFLLFGIRAKELSNDIAQLARRPPTAKEIITGEVGNFFTKRIRAYFKDLKDVLELSGRENQYRTYCRLSILFAAAGTLISLALNNLFLAPVLTLLGLLAPMLTARILVIRYRKEQNAEIATGLSIVTSSYLRTKNLLYSVKENLEYIHEPVKSVFRRFLAQNEFLTSNIERSLMDIEDIVKNDVWKEWCEAMILCQHDRTKADMLDPIINKLRNMDSVQTELDAMLYKPIGVFMTMLVLVLINFPILFFLNREWFNILIYSNPGKLAVTITFAVLLYSLFALIRAIRPLEYKR